MKKPKILAFDIETSPLLVYSWGLGEQRITLDQLYKDWCVLSYAAKWVGEKKIFYRDQRNSKRVFNDKKLLKELWKLLNDADLVLTQNGKKFDSKKVNARFVKHGMKPPAPYRHIDTLQISRKNFAFTSNKLAYTTSELNKKYKKLDHGKFPGLTLWRECLSGNKAAWDEMKKYNIHDVLALEELYFTLQPWHGSQEHSLFTEEKKCACGSVQFQLRGFAITGSGKYRRYQCKKCGSWSRGTVNVLRGLSLPKKVN